MYTVQLESGVHCRQASDANTQSLLLLLLLLLLLPAPPGTFTSTGMSMILAPCNAQTQTQSCMGMARRKGASPGKNYWEPWEKAAFLCTGWGQLLNVERSQLLNTGTDKTEQRPSESSERSRAQPGHCPAWAAKNPRQVNSSISRCTVRPCNSHPVHAPPLPWSSNSIIVGIRQLVVEISFVILL
jgi:hypothetical protein